MTHHAATQPLPRNAQDPRAHGFWIGFDAAPADPTATGAEAPPRRHGPPTIVLAGAATVVCCTAAAALIVHRQHDRTAAAPPVATIAVHGTVTVADTTGTQLSGSHGRCRGIDKHADLVGGARVVIADEAGRVLASTRLGGGVGDILGCRFPITASVPAGHTSYLFTIARRPAVTTSADDLTALVLPIR